MPDEIFGLDLVKLGFRGKDDVVTTSGKTSLVTLGYFLKTLLTWVTDLSVYGWPQPSQKWFTEGMEIEYLPQGGTWQKGRLRFRLEFIPDEPETQPLPDEPRSPLDDLRAELNLNNE